MNIKLKWGTAGRLRRGAVILGVVGLTAGAAVMTAGSALAANGSQPGNLTLNPASGAATLTPTWSTSTACPAGNQAAAQVSEFNTDGTLASRISNVVNSPTAPITNATLQGSVGALLGSTNLPASGGTVEWAVGCYAGAGATGAVVYVQSTFVTLTSAGQYSTSATGPVLTATNTVLTAPTTAAVGATVNLSANVTAGTAFPAGTVQFTVNGTNLGTPVAVNTGNVSVPATTSTTFSATGSQTVGAQFIPTASTTFAGSNASAQITVQPAGTQTAGSEPISVTVPQSGSLTVTVATGTVTLAPAAPATTPDETATGSLQNVTVSDTRNFVPGWAVSGQESTFTGSGTAAGSTISGNALGWTPTQVGAVQGNAVLGSAVAPVGGNAGSTGPGLGSTAAVLAQAHAGNGFGTNVYSANLLLDIPPSALAGPYAGSLTVTYVVSNP
jgi:hypothetical protein